MEQLMWASNTGQLAEALGVSQHRSAVVERTLAPIIAKGGTLREMFDALEALELTFNEWTSAVFALGYFNGVHA